MQWTLQLRRYSKKRVPGDRLRQKLQDVASFAARNKKAGPAAS